MITISASSRPPAGLMQVTRFRWGNPWRERRTRNCWAEEFAKIRQRGQTRVQGGPKICWSPAFHGGDEEKREKVARRTEMRSRWKNVPKMDQKRSTQDPERTLAFDDQRVRRKSNQPRSIGGENSRADVSYLCHQLCCRPYNVGGHPLLRAA